MNASSRAPGYDLFKLIVTIILLLVFLLLWLGIKPVQAPQAEQLPLAGITSTSPTETPLSTPSTTLRASLTPVPASNTPPPPTETPLPTATATVADTSTPEPPSSTETPMATEEALPTPIVEIPAQTSDCEAVSRSQLQVGMQATIKRKVNLRSSPGLFNNWIAVNQPDTQVEVIGGPACTRYKNGGAYLWWQIKLANGTVGWSAEASAFGSFYFMEPVK